MLIGYPLITEQHYFFHAVLVSTGRRPDKVAFVWQCVLWEVAGGVGVGWGGDAILIKTLQMLHPLTDQV